MNNLDIQHANPKVSRLVQGAIKQSTGATPAAKDAQQAAQMQGEVDVSRDLLFPMVDIGAGIKIRKPSVASAALLRELQSPLLKSAALEDHATVFTDILMFIVLQTMPIREAAQLVGDNPEEVRFRAMELGERLTPEEGSKVIAKAVEVLKGQTSTQVTATVPPTKKSGKGDEGNASSRRGQSESKG